MSHGKKGNSKDGARGRLVKVVILFAAGAFIGYCLGFRLPEERKNRAKKLLTEAREMPFRVFV